MLAQVQEGFGLQELMIHTVFAPNGMVGKNKLKRATHQVALFCIHDPKICYRVSS
jgi:hypothetical protein